MLQTGTIFLLDDYFQWHCIYHLCGYMKDVCLKVTFHIADPTTVSIMPNANHLIGAINNVKMATLISGGTIKVANL